MATTTTQISPHTKTYRTAADEAWRREDAAICDTCRHAWPCDTAIVAADNDRLRAALTTCEQALAGADLAALGSDKDRERHAAALDAARTALAP